MFLIFGPERLKIGCYTCPRDSAAFTLLSGLQSKGQQFSNALLCG